jgi:hypothetical protein
MGELSEKGWAVISERGCEASAVRLVGRLREERVRGLCVVTEAAARRLQASARPSPNGNRPKPAKAARTKRAAKK